MDISRIGSVPIAETQFAETLTLTLNSNFSKSGFGESGIGFRRNGKTPSNYNETVTV